MKKVITLFILISCILYAYPPITTIFNISGHPPLTVVVYSMFIDLSCEVDNYSILKEVSLGAGNTYNPITTTYLNGELQGLSPSSRHVVWDGYGCYPSEFSAKTQLKIVASVEGEGNILPGEGVTDTDGNFYPSVIIGNQEWMAENLKTTKYRNGAPIEYHGTNNTAWQSNTTGAYTWYINDITWKDSYGALYNWHAVNNSNGLCPAGWHVPSDAEWTELIDYLVEQGYPNSNIVNGAGNTLKSCRQISSPLGGDCATSEHPHWISYNTPHYGTDEFGFSALPAGILYPNGSFYTVGHRGYWWSATESSSMYAWSRGLYFNFGYLSQYGTNKDFGFSVRCTRD